jgi:hypothetical protein
MGGVVPFLVAVLITLGLWPLWAAAAQPGLGPWRGLLAAAGLGVAGLGLLGALARPLPDPEVPTDRPIEVHGGGDGFVSSDSCRSCHPREDASWRASFHRTMTQVATPETVIPALELEEFEFAGDRLRLARRGDRYFAGIARPAREGGGWVEREVVQTTGSHHFQAYWFANGHGRELTMFPYCYRIDIGRWMPVDAAFLMPPDTRQPLGGARWNTNCVLCHTTQGRPRVHEVGQVDTHVAEFGIACEACHGPAAAHVAAHRDPLRRYRAHLGGEADPTIANPLRMTPEREAEVCGQCHGVTIARAERQADWAREGFGYRPGDLLADSRLLVGPGQRDAVELRGTLARQPDFFDTIFWRDGQVRIGGRDYHGLLASPCYADGQGTRKMTCLSCHAMHKAADDPQSDADWADDQLKPGMRGDRACLQCHADFEEPAARSAHTRHEAGSTSCYDCHMPYTTFGLLKAIRSHTVSSPSVAETAEFGRPNACNLCHLDRTLAWTGAELAKGWDTDEGETLLHEDERKVAAGVLWALKGDAGVRALVAAAFGRPEARAAAGGGEWMGASLAELLRDDYHAVRFVAQRALLARPGGAGYGYDFLAPEAERNGAVARLVGEWELQVRRPGAVDPDPGRRAALLLDREGAPMWGEHRRLLAGRDRRRIYLGE